MLIHSDKQLYTTQNNNLRIAVYTTKGDREDQQDSAGFFLNENKAILLICDGMGGYQCGGAASKCAVESILQSFESHINHMDAHTFFRDVLIRTDNIIANIQDEEGTPISAGSTTVAVLIDDDGLYWASVGDSRAYFKRGNAFVQITQDQNYRTVLDGQIAAGLVSPDEYEKEIQKGDRLINYLGLGDLSLIDYNSTPVAISNLDRILLASDGLYRVVSDVEIGEILNNFSNPVDALMAFEKKAASLSEKNNIVRDNMTIAILDIKQEDNK